jgi:hypothetical protein
MTALHQFAHHTFVSGLVLLAAALVWLSRIDRRP